MHKFILTKPIKTNAFSLFMFITFMIYSQMDKFAFLGNLGKS